MLKKAVHDAKLNCGRCPTCREIQAAGGRREDSGCERWTLHGFRRTFATQLHEQGFSVRQLMTLLGHADLETTLAYLGDCNEKTMEGIRF